MPPLQHANGGAISNKRIPKQQSGQRASIRQIAEEVLTVNCRHGMFSSTWSVLVVKRIGWASVLPLVMTVVFVSVVPVADQPETAFNEIDAPVNQTTPVAPRVRLTPPHELRIVLPRSFTRMSEGIRSSLESISRPMHWHLSPLPELLCTLLI